jgi:hypothetical protein
MVKQFYGKLNDDPWELPRPRALSEDGFRGKLARLLGMDYVATAKGVTFEVALLLSGPLKDLPQLDHVSVHRCPETKALQVLTSLPQLRSLDLPDRKLQDIGFLSNATQLRLLYLTGTCVQDISPLAEVLDLSGTPVRDITPLAGLSRLKSLSLFRTPVTDLTPLHQLSQLRELSLGGHRVSDEAQRAFETAVPGCTVWWFPDSE